MSISTEMNGIIVYDLPTGIVQQVLPPSGENVYPLTKGEKGDPGPSGPQGPPGQHLVAVIGEIPSGAINGSNATFTTQFAFVPESVEVFLNGLAQRKPDHFNTTGTNIINLSDSPQTGELIQVNYLRA